jgi:hypothetical protein
MIAVQPPGTRTGCYPFLLSPCHPMTLQWCTITVPLTLALFLSIPTRSFLAFHCPISSLFLSHPIYYLLTDTYLNITSATPYFSHLLHASITCSPNPQVTSLGFITLVLKATSASFGRTLIRIWMYLLHMRLMHRCSIDCRRRGVVRRRLGE